MCHHMYLHICASSANEEFSKLFVNEVEDYTNDKVKLVIIWSTRKIQSIFNYKDKVQHHRCVIYCVVCPCGADYIGENSRNSERRDGKNIALREIKTPIV